MATTTLALIRDTMVSTVSGLTPTVLGQRRYEPHREAVDFDTFIEANPTRAFRVFTIRDTFEHEGPLISNTDVEEMRTVFELRCGYPRDFRYGAQMAFDRDDVINADLLQLRNAIGVNGYATLEASVGASSASVFGEAVSRVQGTATDVLVIRLSVMWKEAL